MGELKMKDFRLDKEKFSDDNQEDNHIPAIRNRMAERMQKVQAEIAANKAKPKRKVLSLRNGK